MIETIFDMRTIQSFLWKTLCDSKLLPGERHLQGEVPIFAHVLTISWIFAYQRAQLNN